MNESVDNKSVKFSIPFNWQGDMKVFLAECDFKDRISEVYARLPKDAVGGGRAAFSLPFVSAKKATADISYLKENGVRFNYILNAVCAGNMEFTDKGYKNIRRLLDYLSEAGVYAVTVSMPYLLKIIKTHYPQLKVFASAMAEADTLDRILFWKDEGADKITLPAYKVNRDLHLLKRMQENSTVPLQLIVNNGCLLNCPLAQSHASASAHASNKKHKSCGVFPDMNFLMCRYKRYADKNLFLKSDFIRPEDLSFYREKTGIVDFKLVDRRCSSEVLKRITDAYLSESYEGNLADLLPVLAGKSFNVHDRWFYKIAYLKTLLMYRFKDLKTFGDAVTQAKVFIDNKKLDGFIEHVYKSGCRNHKCADCGVCEKFMQKAFSAEEDYLKTQKAVLAEAIDKLL